MVVFSLRMVHRVEPPVIRPELPERSPVYQLGGSGYLLAQFEQLEFAVKFTASHRVIGISVTKAVVKLVI